MPVVIQNFRCDQIPELRIIGLNTAQGLIKYFVHASQVVALLTGKNPRAALNVLHNLISGSEGGAATMRQGGDLATAYQTGQTDATIYTHRIHNGIHPSYFFTFEGVEETLRSLPNQLEEARQRLLELFDAYSTSASTTFNLDTSHEGGLLTEEEEKQGLLAEEEETEEGQELEIIPKSINWCVRFAFQAERQKSAMALEAEKARSAALNAQAALKAEKEKASLMLQAKEDRHEKEKAEMKLQMRGIQFEKDMAIQQSKWNDERSQLQAEIAKKNIEQAETGRMRIEQDQFTAKVARIGSALARPDDMPKLSCFHKMQCSKWSNSDYGVNLFVDLPDDADEIEQEEPEGPSPTLVARLASGVDCNPGIDNKFNILAFCYKGTRITKRALSKSKTIKDAFGVEVDGIHYVCIVLFKTRSRRMGSIGTVPYKSGILPKSIVPERIISSDPAQLCHVSVLNIFALTDDPVITMLKRPCQDKWKWHNADDAWKQKPVNEGAAGGGGV